MVAYGIVEHILMFSHLSDTVDDDAVWPRIITTSSNN